MPEYKAPGVYVEEIPTPIQPIDGVSTSTAGFIGIMPTSFQVPETNPLTYKPELRELTDNEQNKLAKPGEVKLCTNFSEFKRFFGGFSSDEQHNILAHAVYGFFNNGGKRCYVVTVIEESSITVDFLENTFAVIDEIAIVAAPGITNQAVRDSIITHCKERTGDRFAILDIPLDVADDEGNLDLTKLNPLTEGEDDEENLLPDYSDYAAYYFPALAVYDPVAKSQNPDINGHILTG